MILITTQLTYSTNEINSAQYLKVEINHSISFKLENEKDSAFNYLDVYSYYLPQTLEPHQYLNSYKTSSDGQLSFSDSKEIPSIKYSYTATPKSNNEDFVTSFIVESTPNYPKISNNQRFPYTAQELSQYSKYLQFTEQINLDQNIKLKAQQLAYGENDTYIIATKIANWVQEEIEYDLSTVFLNPDQKATEVFESKKGVCKELSIIYSSMLRSLDIPTRMVMGYAYTNSEDIIDLVGSNWGGHAWVEVLIGDEWVPFDLTYQQYGYVDASHIVFQYTSDISQLGVQMEMSAYQYKIKDNSLQSSFNFKTLTKSGIVSPIQIKSKLNSEYKEIKPESEIKITAIVQNSKNYYQTFPLELVYPKEIINKSPKKLIVYLKPNEEKEIDFFLKTPNLDGYIFPFSIFSGNEELANYSILLDSRKDLIIETQNKEIDLDQQFNFQSINENENTNFEKIEYSISHDCKSSIVNSKLNINCRISNISDIEFISFCSAIECNEFNNSNNENLKELNVESSLFSKYSLIYNDVVQNFDIIFDIPELKYSYSVDENILTLNSQIKDSNDLKYSIVLETGAYSINISDKKQIDSIQLPEGKFTGVIYYYYMNELISTEIISFEIENTSLIYKIKKLIDNLFY